MINRKEAKEIGLKWNNFTFKVSQDDTFIYLAEDILTDEERKNLYNNLSQIKEFLLSQGIKLILEEPEFIEGKIIFAKAHPPKEGVPERFEFLPKFSRVNKIFEVEEENLKPEDLRERFQKILCAEKDEVIAKWFPPIPPAPGVNIWGDPIPPPPLKEEKILELGENLYINERDNSIRAKVSGVVIYDKKKLEIYPEFVLKGDVDFSVGNINFIGQKLIIQGDVKFGFTVNCKGNLELKGCTENKVTIFVEGIFQSEGVLRGEETIIKVKGEARIKGAEFATLEIEGDLFVKDYLIFTKTNVTGNILATEGKGIIYGGVVLAEGIIETKSLGHVAQTKTEIRAGYRKEKINTFLALAGKMELYEELLKKINSGIELANKLMQEGRLSSKQEQTLNKLVSEKEKIERSLKEAKDSFKILRKEIEDLKDKKIKVLQKVYPNVILGIAEVTYTVGSELKGPLVFYLEDHNIKTMEVAK